jgi:hypothetical protein
VTKLKETLMDAPASAASAEKPLDAQMAEDICELLEQTILKYFPRSEDDIDRRKPASVPLVPNRQDKPET